MGKSFRALTALAFAACACAWAAGAAGAAVVYDSVPTPLPGNVASIGFEATSASEFGDEVQFAGTARSLTSVTVTMSSWACQSGRWNTGDCATASGATFAQALTLRLYAVDDSSSTPAPGALLATRTQTFQLPYRPSADPSCTGGRWKAMSGTCYSGIAAPVTFDFSAAGLTLPDEVIWGITYDTTHAGQTPIGEAAPCYATTAGCAYDALNVGSDGAGPSVGTDPNPDGAFLDASAAGSYCDFGAGGTGTFRLDDGCWGGFTPQARFESGTSFGDCIVDDDPVAKRSTLLADCTTDETLLIPDGYTFDGDGHTVTAVDPAGGHFLGAVVQNGGTTANVEDLIVRAAGLTDACDAGRDALAGVRLVDASGTVSDVQVLGLNQGTASGCQEGDAFEFRSTTGSRTVLLRDSTATGYQKTGVLVTGDVAAILDGNTITGYGASTVIAQNGIQVSFGASARVYGNSISGNNYTPKSYTACGLLIYKAGGVGGRTKSGPSFVERDNTFAANEANVCNYGKGGGPVSPA
jgi:hypothetical protein